MEYTHMLVRKYVFMWIYVRNKNICGTTNLLRACEYHCHHYSQVVILESTTTFAVHTQSTISSRSAITHTHTCAQAHTHARAETCKNRVPVRALIWFSAWWILCAFFLRTLSFGIAEPRSYKHTNTFEPVQHIHTVACVYVHSNLHTLGSTLAYSNDRATRNYRMRSRLSYSCVVHFFFIRSFFRWLWLYDMCFYVVRIS